ncbi:MAG: hypothetical protein HEEMFOPI_01101 [Holosporales bacterium]
MLLSNLKMPGEIQGQKCARKKSSTMVHEDLSTAATEQFADILSFERILFFINGLDQIFSLIPSPKLKKQIRPDSRKTACFTMSFLQRISLSIKDFKL